LLPDAAAKLAIGARPTIWHQCGRQHFDVTQQAYTDAGIEARIEAFIEDMASAYAWADLVICRAGALTVAELAAAGVGSILVPYPYAVDDHQTANAAFLERAGAAVIVQQRELTAGMLAGLLQDMNEQRDRLLDMAEAARAQAKTNATEIVAQRCMLAMQGQL
jgi:UDP-N-acetylglucosamine--N-acetylmuramyl-(pentapeptide) pyrophosphoryl-undecaprenol N-acetylglucosamine transferase